MIVTSVEEIVVDLPVDRWDRSAGARRDVAVEVVSGTDRPSHWWVALFLAFLHRHTASEHIHLVGASAGEGAVELRGFPLAGTDTLTTVAERVVSAPKSAPVQLIERAAQAGGWWARVLAGLPGSAATSDIRLEIADGRVTLHANEALWTRQSVERMADQLVIMSGPAAIGGSGAPEPPIAELPMLAPEERARILLGWNDTAQRWPDTSYPDLVEEHVRAKPGEPAIVHAGRTITYGELGSLTNRLARKLIELGAEPGRRVGLLLPRSADFIVATLGVFKTGAAVVPLDPVNPDTRIGYMIGDSEPLVVIAGKAQRHRVPKTVPCLVIGGDDLDGVPDDPVSAPVTDDTISHLIYTSGSTGDPKAVLERHRALVNLVHWTKRAYDVRPGDRASWLSTPGFAVQVMEWMPYIALGVPVHIGDPVDRTPEQLRDWLLQEGITHAMLVAALAERAWAVTWPADTRLRIMVTTGERVHTWPPADKPFTVVMTYGSTETTHVLTCLDIGAGIDFTSAATPEEVRAVRPVPVGRPISNLRVYLLDPAGAPVPVGAVGRVHVAGAGMSAGYHERPELTDSKFLANPLPEEPEPILYDTGDLARFRADGAIELLGRSDSQVKIRGFRVELGEVESVVCAAPGVEEGVVVTYEPTPGDVRLAAYVAGARLPTPQEVRTYVSNRLPHYMVPSVVVPLGKLPRLANSKLDLRSLPAPEETIRDGLSTEFAEPRGPLQKEVARIWSEVLRVDRVGAHDNFFELGGHSVLAVRMASAVGAAFDVKIKIPDLCKHATVAAFAEYIDAIRGSDPEGREK
ncbi:amino acid adenylation domain-containing protein [Nonomuraea polychroma]|uniref:Amino acid adenylation domain-containing protein n=1 Tax=Nonomuraea polychroma TaxID=46176 RepID=A0A438LZF6_9ACTN|nr:non-ribosomal peptide synthetase [Nonomuraea polychroma]RVX38737.1 amino acid adenylation domain-containing protein [Nonomuraea polychroma]